MQRNASAADERPESPAELIARITAEHRTAGDRASGDRGDGGGRHGAVAVLPPRTRRRAVDEDDAPVGRHGSPDLPTEARSGRHGTPEPDEAVTRSGRHGRAATAAASTTSVGAGTRGAGPDAGSTGAATAGTRRRRRSADPSATGSSAVDTAAVDSPSVDSPSVDSMTSPSLAARPAGSTRRRRRAAGRDSATVVTRDVESGGRSFGRRLAPLAVGVVVVVLATLVATLVRPDPGSEPELSSALVQEPPALVAPDEGSGATVPPPVSDAPESVGPVTPGDGALVVDGVTWTPAGGDEFTNGLGPGWTVYDQDGRSPDAVSVADGVLTLRGDAAGRTGGVAWTEGSRFGRWEMRARFPAGDPRYHPVLLLWPTDVPWPGGGEIDFAETASGSGVAQFFLHHGADNSQLYAERALDTTQWHDYAVEWTENRVTGYVDGQKWFESTDPNTLPPGNMQAVVQLDWFPQDNPATGPAAPTEMQVDHVRIYT